MKTPPRYQSTAKLEMGRKGQRLGAVVSAMAAALSCAQAQSIDPAFSSDYSVGLVGNVASGGIVIATTALAFKDANTLLVASHGGHSDASIYTVPVDTRRQ